jgi:hypothetical protein
MTEMLESVTWVDPSGVEHPWPHVLLRGMSGRGAPPVSISSRAVTGRPGSVRIAARHLERRIHIPLLLTGSPGAVRALARGWAKQLNTVPGVGTLRFALVDGQQRQISASVAGGMELEEDVGSYAASSIEFVAHDPFFEDGAISTASAVGGAPRLFFPGFPLQLSSSELAVALVVNNDGDDDVWPIITITGPATDPSVTLSGGRKLALTGVVAAGATVTLDARPGAKTVVNQSGTSLYGSLTSAQWFRLPTGPSRVDLQAIGTTAATAIAMQWRRRWLTV